MNPRKILLAVGALLTIGASSVWIYHREFRTPEYNVALHQRIGEVIAEQTAKAAPTKARILVITIPTDDQPELETQIKSFNRALQRLGDFSVKDHELDTKDQPKYGPGTGLSGRRFVRAVNNHPCDAIVSFVGAPKLSDEQIGEMKYSPIFIAETRSTDHLPKLFEKKVIRVAVVSRFLFPAPGPLKPSTPQEWFDKRYQIVTALDPNTIPAAE